MTMLAEAVGAIDIFERRVLFVEGKARDLMYSVGEVPRLMRELESRVGPKGSVQQNRAIAGSNPLSLGMLNVTEWTNAERTWARNVGAVVVAARSALVRYQEQVDVLRRMTLPRDLQAHVTGLVERGNRAVGSVERDIEVWRGLPASVYDPYNQDITRGLLRTIIPDSLSYAVMGASTAVAADVVERHSEGAIRELKGAASEAVGAVSWYAGFVNRAALNQLRASDYVAISLFGIGVVGASYVVGTVGVTALKTYLDLRGIEIKL